MRCPNSHILVGKRVIRKDVNLQCVLCKETDVQKHLYHYACDQMCIRVCVPCYHMTGTLGRERLNQIIAKKRERENRGGGGGDEEDKARLALMLLLLGAAME